MWWFLSFLVGVLVFGVEYFVYDIVIRDMVNILPHISIVTFFFLNQLLKVFIFNYDRVASLSAVVDEYSKKNDEFAKMVVDYKIVWKYETKYRIYRLLTIAGGASFYYFFFINNKWLFSFLVDMFSSIGIYF